ncbi:BRO-N domain-containing protein [Billgrantia gudaonensis]|uniref:BRO family, N-terminal domain n=1 Tax=Billgrantia gudaonensis TaxID=376427 RepID=A0A1G9EBD5_9GAMM|nr:BRO family protein [Halomonas gudaonensis]SDK73391.1 BRO family, N-terminal domain [Halomonas gudaonensis]
MTTGIREAQPSIRTFNTANHITGVDLDIRVVDQGMTPWFVANDVIKALGLYASEYRRLDDVEKRLLRREQLGLKPGKPMIVISESGLYKLIMRSDKPQARAFQDWVTKVVLPAIRKDGMYVAGEEKVSTGEMTEDEMILKAMEALKAKCDRLAEENEYMDNLPTLSGISLIGPAGATVGLCCS